MAILYINSGDAYLGVRRLVVTVRDSAGVAVDAEDTEDLRGRYLWELQGIDAVGVVTLASGAMYIKSDLILAAS